MITDTDRVESQNRVLKLLENPRPSADGKSHPSIPGLLNTKNRFLIIPQSLTTRFKPFSDAKTRLSAIIIRNFSDLPGLASVHEEFFEESKVKEHGGLVLPVLVRTLKPRNERSKSTIRAEFDDITSEFIFSESGESLEVSYSAIPLPEFPTKIRFIGKIVRGQIPRQKVVQVPRFIGKLIAAVPTKSDYKVGPIWFGDTEGNGTTHSPVTASFGVEGLNLRHKSLHWVETTPEYASIQQSKLGSFVLLEMHLQSPSSNA